MSINFYFIFRCPVLILGFETPVKCSVTDHIHFVFDLFFVICPYDSSVLEENLQSHLKRCPFFKQAQSLSLQPFYQEGINAGKEEEEEGEQNFSSEMKRNAVHGMTLLEFSQLINKIKSVHASICSDIRDSFKIPQACDIWTNRQVDRCSTIVLFRMCCVHFMFP